MLKFLLLFFTVLSSSLYAQKETLPTAQELFQTTSPEAATEGLVPPEGGIGFGYPDIATEAAILIFLALLPFLIMLLTSFMKMVITLSLLAPTRSIHQS